MEKELEKIKRRSQMNALMTLLSAILVIGSLAFSFFTLNKMEKKRDLLDQEIAQKQAQFDKLGKMLVEASAENTTMQSNHAIDEAAKYFLEVKSQEGDLTLTEELKLLSSVNENELSPEQKRRKQALEKETENNATVNDDSKITTCVNVVNNIPQGAKSEFDLGEAVYFHAKINSPGNETIRAEWKKGDDKFHEKKFDIGLNTGDGFNIWDFKKIREAGNYSIMLYNSSDLLIGKTIFTVE